MDEPVPQWSSLDRFAFGDNPELADALLELVLAGKKRATCWAASEGEKTHIGKLWVVLDGAGRPAAAIETTGLELRRFGEVDAAFAFAEGEGDRTLAHWREAHRRYFTRRGEFAPDVLLWCERFRLVARLPGRFDRRSRGRIGGAGGEPRAARTESDKNGERA
jgi:uncharacterized protein YhfF